jgi:hypothetical protein
MKGTAGIPALQLVTLNKLISQIDKTPSNFFTNLFSAVQYPSDSIKWELEYASGGMTPFVAPGSVAPTIGIDGISEGSAKAAYWKEKMYFDEEFLNNLRQPGTTATYQTAERQLAKGVKKLRYRCERRREWMCQQMVSNGQISYNVPGGARFVVSYGIPSTHFLTLTSGRMWGGATPGANRNPIEDIFDAKTVLLTDAGVIPNNAMMNSQMLKVLMLDGKLQALLEKSAFGIGALTVYDELYEVQAYITGISTVTITLDDVTDFEVGAVARFVNMKLYNVWEDRVITGVSTDASTITIASATTATFLAGRDKVVARKKFILDNEFLMFADTANGEKIGEFMESPYGMDRRWGFYADTELEWDPEGCWLRVQDKGLPVLYRPDTTFKITAW